MLRLNIRGEIERLYQDKCRTLEQVGLNLSINPVVLIKALQCAGCLINLYNTVFLLYYGVYFAVKHFVQQECKTCMCTKVFSMLDLDHSQRDSLSMPSCSILRIPAHAHCQWLCQGMYTPLYCCAQLVLLCLKYKIETDQFLCAKL